MNNLDQVDAIRDRMVAEGAPKPEIIRQEALACLGWPYVFGAWGEPCTPAGRKRRARAEYPTIKSKCQVLRDTDPKETCSGCKWYPGGFRVRMYDCRGFTDWLLRQVGLGLAGSGATSQYNTAANWIRRGKIDEMPDCVCCVFRAKGNKKEHTGMHIGGGVVIDCSTGVSSVGMNGWTHYGIPVGLYEEEEIPVETVKRTLRRGSKGEDVRELQELLTRLGYDCGEADGVYGTKTIEAVKDFQKKSALEADGICGPKTWAALDDAAALTPPQEPVTYRVTIEGVTWTQYRKIMEICPLARAEKE